MNEIEVYDMLTTEKQFNPIPHTRYSYYYCEHGVYLIKDTISGNKILIQANSPYKAIEKLLQMK